MRSRVFQVLIIFTVLATFNFAPANESGNKLETRLARGTWVVIKRGKTWLITAMRGLPAEGEQRVRPGTDL